MTLSLGSDQDSGLDMSMLSACSIKSFINEMQRWEKKSRESREGSAWKHRQAASSSNFLLLRLCQGIIKRDELVFRAAKRRGIPVLMMTSGGYQKKTARIIADSILNLHRQGLIEGNAAEGEGSTPLTTHMTPTSGSAGSTSTAVWGALILELTLRYLTVKH